MPALSKPKTIFTVAIALMLLCAGVATYTIFRLYTSEQSVRHNYQVLLELGQLQTDLSKAGRLRRSILDSGGSGLAADFQATREQINADLSSLRALNANNPEQQTNSSRLDASVRKRLEILEASIRAGGSANSEGQIKYTDESVRSAF